AVTQAVARQYLWDQALRVVWRGEAYLRAGRLHEAGAQAQQALAVAEAPQGRGHAAHAPWPLRARAAPHEPPGGRHARTPHQQALVLADALGMRPLQAHCHHGLGTLYAATGQQEPARRELATAIALYRAMDMTFWLPQTEAVLAQVEEQ